MSNLPLARRLALLHPGFLSLIWLLSGTIPVPPAMRGFALFALTCGWAWAIYVVSVAKAPQDSHPRWTHWVFLAPPLLFVIGAVTGPLTPNSPTSILIVGTLFFSLWRTAQALEYADQQGKPVMAGRIAGTMFLMFFSIVGFWWLRQRIVRVAAASAA